MGELRKFMFDNFVVEEGKKTSSAPVVEPEIIEDVSSEIPDFIPVIEDTMPIVQEPSQPIEPAIKEITYSQQELDDKVHQVEEVAYQKGLQEAKDSLDNISIGVLTEINNQLLKLLAHTEESDKALEKQSLELIKMVIKTLIPTLSQEHATEIVNNFIADNFKNIKKEAKLSFYIHPDIISYVQENIAKLANKNDFEGKISLHKDSVMNVSDCRIEWASGGVERNTEQLLDNITDMLGSNPS